MKEFCYMSVHVSTILDEESIEADLDQLDYYGNNGWEFVAIIGTRAVFKREKGASR